MAEEIVRAVVTTTVDQLPERLRSAMLCAIDVVKRYQLPCDVAFSDIPNTARHGWRKDGTCVIFLSFDLAHNGDSKSVHRRVIHEAAHHMAGFNLLVSRCCLSTYLLGLWAARPEDTFTWSQPLHTVHT